MKSLLLLLIAGVLLAGCTSQPQENAMPSILPTVTPLASPSIAPIVVDREGMIPQDAVKITVATDVHPLEVKSSDYETPVALPYPVSTAGAEDSAFITPDGKTLYFFFTPDVRVPVEKQLLDGVTGIYVSHKQNNGWSNPERVWLQEPGKLSLDGCEFVQNNEMWFCSAREGYTGVNLFTAELKNGVWSGVTYVGDKLMKEYQVGEMHITADGNELYFHSQRPGGKGGLDIWVSTKQNGEWQEPENIEAVNTNGSEGWPFLTQDGNELWISKDYGLWRSEKVNGEWTKPELMISPLAGEASLDNEGNVYFTHHYYEGDAMLEADIFVAYKK